MSAHANLLIGIEGHTDLSVFYLLMVAQEAHGLHDFGYASLVVCTKQGVSVSDDKVFTDVFQQLGELLW